MVLEQYSADLDTYRKTAIAEAQRGDADGLARSCHALKGLAGSFGSQDLAQLAYQIEDSARYGDTAIAFAVTLDRLDAAIDEALNACNELRENPLPSNHE